VQILYSQDGINEEFREKTSIGKEHLGRVLKGVNIPFCLAVLGVGIGYGNLNLNATGSKVHGKAIFRKLPGTITMNLADELTHLQLQTHFNSDVMFKDLILLAQKGSGALIGIVVENDNKKISLLRREGQKGSTDIDVK